MSARLLRPAIPAEAPLLHAITQAAFAQYACYEQPSSALRESLRDVREHLQLGGGVLAFVDERPAGAGRFALDPRGGFLSYSRLAVLPAARGRGLGGAIVRWMEEHARALGLHEIRTEARSQQPDNRPYYVERGYEICGYSERYGIPDLSTHLRKLL